MRAFRFSLESVLRLRQTQWKLEEEKLRKLLAEKQHIEAQIVAVQDAKRQATQTQVDASTTSGAEFQAVARYLVGLQARHSRLTALLREVNTEANRQREIALDAQRKVELLESLKDKRHQEWKRELDAETEALAADIYLSKRAREG